MLEVDLDKFWADDIIAHKDNCFNKDATQVAMAIRMSDECVFSELGEEGQPWGYTPRERRIDLNKRYNDIAERIVGKRLLNENFLPDDSHLPPIKQIGEVFGGVYEFRGDTTWLHSNIETAKDLEKQLDKIDKMDFASFIMPDNWEQEKKRIFDTYGIRPSNFKYFRGPVTLASSILGTENFIYMFMDEPELIERLRESIIKVIFDYLKVVNNEAAYKGGIVPHEFYFFDDDCALMTPDMYEFFGYQILKAIFEKVSPNDGDIRFQHSDSAMGHLLPILSKLNLTGCNFGPTLTVREIRAHMPNTCIDGQLAPFTFMRNNQDDIIAEVKRDCEMAKEGNLRGVNIATAGSINNGSSLLSMRAVMHAIQKYGQY